MGEPFNRISRVVRAELNSNQGNSGINSTHATVLAAGGAVTGASLGKVGILAGGTGYSLGTVSLATTGALAGLALYEVLRSLIEEDVTSTSAAAIGAAAGIATSATIGGVGISVGGSAIGLGMASMAAGGAVLGLGLVSLTRLLQQGIDPEKLLDCAIEQMETDLREARQSAINVIASQKRLQQQHERAQAEVKKWERRVKLALQQGDDFLAREALNRKKMHLGILDSLEGQVNQNPSFVQDFKRKLTLLETKISEAKAMRTNLKAQIAMAKVNAQITQMNTSNAMTAFERMEDKVLQLEARSQAAELSGADLESQYAALVSSDPNVDLELEAMRAQMLSSLHHSQSSVAEPLTVSSSYEEIDRELEDLKRQLDQL